MSKFTLESLKNLNRFSIVSSGKCRLDAIRAYSQDCYDRNCKKEDNYWKGKLEMPDFDYLQPKTLQFNPRYNFLVENPSVPLNFDVYKERNCRILKKCKEDEAAAKKQKKSCPDMPKQT